MGTAAERNDTVTVYANGDIAKNWYVQNFRTAPDIFVWGNSGIPLDVRYRYPAGTWLNFADSRLDVSINNSYLRSLPLELATRRARGEGRL